MLHIAIGTRRVRELAVQAVPGCHPGAAASNPGLAMVLEAGDRSQQRMARTSYAMTAAPWPTPLLTMATEVSPRPSSRVQPTRHGPWRCPIPQAPPREESRVVLLQQAALLPL